MYNVGLTKNWNDMFYASGLFFSLGYIFLFIIDIYSIYIVFFSLGSFGLLLFVVFTKKDGVF